MFVLAGGAGAGIVVGRELRPSAHAPQPVRTSTTTISRVSEVIVKLTTDSGLVGIGEAHGPFLFQQGADGLRSVKGILEAITPLVVGGDPFGKAMPTQELVGRP